MENPLSDLTEEEELDLKIQELPLTHQQLWSTLQTLEDGERIKGKDLMIRSGIKEPRQLKKAVEVLRNNGFLVGGSRNGVMGYYEIRDEEDLDRTLRLIRSSAFAMIKTADKVEKTYFQQHYGSLLPLEEDEEDDE